MSNKSRSDDFNQVRKCDICQQITDVHKMALEDEGEGILDGFICDKCFRILIHVSGMTAELEILHRAQDGSISEWMKNEKL